MLRAADAALKTALAELEEAKKTMEWTRKKLMESQEDYRKLSLVLLSVVEAPDPKDAEALLKELDKPCGFRNCELSGRAAKCIRAYAANNRYLTDEIKRLKHEADSR